MGGFQSESTSKKLWVGGGGGQGPIYPFMALTIELEIGTVSQT